MNLKWASVHTLPHAATVVIHGANHKAAAIRAKLTAARPDITIYGEFYNGRLARSEALSTFGTSAPITCEGVTNQTNWIQTAWQLRDAGCTTLYVMPICDATHTKRNCIIVKRARVIFVPIYKCAYSSFTEFFRSAFPEVADAATGTKLNSFVDLQDKRYSEFFKFSVVRDPAARLASCFRDKYGREESHENVKTWKQPLLNLLDCNELTLDDWLSFISSMPDTHSDPHWRSQYFTLHNSIGQCLVDRVYHLENLPKHFDEIAQHLGVPVKLQHFNATRTRARGAKDFDSLMLRKVQVRYMNDFAAFGY